MGTGKPYRRLLSVGNYGQKKILFAKLASGYVFGIRVDITSAGCNSEQIN